MSNRVIDNGNVDCKDRYCWVVWKACDSINFIDMKIFIAYWLMRTSYSLNKNFNHGEPVIML